MKFRFLFLSIIIIFLLCCVSAHKKQAKIYESGLDSMMGKDAEGVASKITATWEFKLARHWRKEDPTLENVFKVSKGKTAFTKEEASKIFAEKGKYEVMLFSKFIRKESAAIGTISDLGADAMLRQKQEYERNAYIRVVFRDGELIHFRVWPSL
jgi:hypothetical protein